MITWSIHRVFLAVVIIVLLPACRPANILSRSQMEDLLVDIHSVEGILEETGLSYGHDVAQRAYYNVVLQKHHVTQEQFDSSLVWYTAHPQTFDKIYPHVQERLTERLNAFNEECDLKTEQELRLRELISMEEMQDSMLLQIQNLVPSSAILLPNMDNPLLRPLQHADTCVTDSATEQNIAMEKPFIRSCVLLRSE